MTWEFLAGIGFGVVTMALGVGWRLGVLPTRKRRAAWYYEVYTNEAMLGPQRWFVYGAIPCGLAFLAATIGAAISSFGYDAPVVVGALLALVLVSVGIALMYQRPRFLKPKWLLDVEAGRQSLTVDRPVGTPRWLVRLMWLAFTLIVAVALYFGAYIVAGAALLAMSWLAATRIRRPSGAPTKRVESSWTSTRRDGDASEQAGSDQELTFTEVWPLDATGPPGRETASMTKVSHRAAGEGGQVTTDQDDESL